VRVAPNRSRVDRWRALAVVLALLVPAGCSTPVNEAFDLACLVYGTPGAPDGALVHMRHHAKGAWAKVAEQPLARSAVLLVPGPYPDMTFQFLTVSSGYRSSSAALWNVKDDSLLAPTHTVSFGDRVVLLLNNNPSGAAAALVFVSGSQIDMRRAEFGREAVALRPNYRCSLAVLRYARPDSLEVIGETSYARAAWLTDARLAYINRAGTLMSIRVDATDSIPAGVRDTLATGVEAVSAAPSAERYAVGYRGDSVAVLAFDGAAVYPTLHDAAVPALAPDGEMLAYQTADLGVWSVELATGHAEEYGIGYPIDWTLDGDLFLFYEREADERKVVHTIYHVADVRTGAAVELPAIGFVIDAVFLP
jgi:hypothetical protein